MRKKPLFFSSRFLLPFAAVLILLGAFLFYYFLIISRQETLTNQRAFRSLASISGEVRDLVSNYGEVFHVVYQNRNPKGEITQDIKEFLATQVPDLKVEVLPNSSQMYRANLAFEHDGWHLQLFNDNLKADSRLSTAFEPLLNETSNRLFDDIFITDANGVVLNQTSRSGVVATDLSSVLTALPAGPRKSKSSSDAKKEDITSGKKGSDSAEAAEPAKTASEDARSRAYAAMTESSNLASVTLAGTEYRAYLVPVALMFEEGNSRTPGTESMRLVLCGLVRQSEFRVQTRSVPGVALTTLILAMVLVIVAAWPVLKFSTMRKTERIPRSAAVLYAVSTTATLILMMVLVIHTRYVSRDPETDQNLEELAKGIDRNFGLELEKALRVMDSVMHSPEFSSNVKEDSPHPCTTVQPFATPNVMSNLLRNNKLRLAEYPYFFRIFAYDSNGSEQVKWTIDQNPPPALRVCGKAYFEGVMKNELWRLSAEGPSGFRFRVDPIYSRLTGEYLAVITQPVPKDFGREHSVLRVSLMAVPMLSLIRPVLPADYGFAVVDGSGKVLFHSDIARNGRENFFDETEGETLRTAVTAAHARTLDVNYLGDGHRMFVTPITSVQRSGWYLITFSNLEIVAAQRVERMVLFSALAFIYFVCIIVSTAVVVLLGRWKRPLVFWPDAKNVGCYIHVFLTISVVTGLCCWVIFVSGSTELLIYGLVIPFCSMLLAVLKLFGHSRPIVWVSIIAAGGVLANFFLRWAFFQGAWRPFPPLILICGALFFLAQDAISEKTGSWANRWFHEKDNHLLASTFSLAYFCLLVLMSVPPCIAAFKAAYDYEETVAAQREQLLVMSALEQRENRVVSRYCRVKFSDVEQETCNDDLARWLFIRRRLEEQDLDVYDSVFSDREKGQLFEPESPAHIPFLRSQDRGSAPPGQPDFLVVLAARFIFRNDSLTRELSQPSSASRWEWTPEGVHRIRIQRSASSTDSATRQALARLYRNDSGFLLQNLAYDLNVLKASDFFKATGLVIAVALFLMFGSVWSALRRMFLLNKSFAELGQPYPEISLEDALQPASGGEPQPNLLLLTFPCSGKTEKLTKLTDGGQAVYVDLTSGKPAAKQKIRDGGSGLIILDHFETIMHDEIISKWTLELLEDLISEEKKVVIISTVDPRYRAGSVAEGAELQRKAGSPKRELGRVERILGRFKTLRVQGETIRHSDSCYHFLWASCAWDEKVALYGIARDGWANHKNFSALSHLYKRGLIKHEPNFVLTFPHFREYLRRTISRKEQVFLELKDTAGLWDGLRVMLYVILIGIVAAVLFFNEHEILGYITTGVSAILPAARLLSQIGGGKSPSTKEGSAEA